MQESGNEPDKNRKQFIPAALLLGLQQGLMSAVKCLKNAYFLKNKKNYKNLKKVVDKSKNLQYNQYCSEGHKEIRKKQRHVRLAQLDRAFGYGPKGRGFESSNARW